MKRIILLAALAALVMGCEKYASDKPESSGFYLDGERVVSIGSAYWGSHNDDSRGRTFHFELYEDGFESGAYPPRFSPCVAAVYGLRETGVSYSAHGYLDHLYIPDIANLGTGLTIPLLQGEYKGGCVYVSSVKFKNFCSVDAMDEVTDEMIEGKIDIIISLKDGRTIRVHYRGPIMHQQYYFS